MENSLGVLVRLFDAYGVRVETKVVKRLFLPSTIQALKSDHPEFFNHKDFVGEADPETTYQKYLFSRKKMRIAKRRSRLLKVLPWIKFAAVSGSVAFNSASKHDDIDIFIVTSPKRLWIVRGLVLLIFGIFGWRRKFGENNVKDKFCLNYFVTSDNLNLRQLPEEDFLTALEIIMLKPILNKNYLDLIIKQNHYIKSYFPKVFNEAADCRAENRDFRILLLSSLLDALDFLAMKMQIIYMKILNHPLEKNVIKRNKAQFFSLKGWRSRKSLLSKLLQRGDY